MNAEHIGKYKSLYVAYSKDEKIKIRGASGGVVSSVLINELEKGRIDAAIVVGMDKQKLWKAKVKIAKTKEHIISAAGSKYVLIPFEDILNAMNKENGNLAVVGLPCHVKTIRNLQKSGKFKNVKLLIGLFCGYNMPFDATEFLLKKLGIEKHEIEKLEYRGGKYPGGFLVTTKDKKTKILPKYYYDFLNLMFVPNGCLNCKDFTNESADISVGDTYNHENCSLLIVRSERGEEAIKDSVYKQTILEEEVLKMHNHNIKHKKDGDSMTMKIIRKSLKIFGKYMPLSILGIMAKLRRMVAKKWQG